jgi:hypothetical protein
MHQIFDNQSNLIIKVGWYWDLTDINQWLLICIHQPEAFILPLGFLPLGYLQQIHFGRMLPLTGLLKAWTGSLLKRL